MGRHSVLVFLIISLIHLLMCGARHVIEVQDQASVGTDSSKYAIIFDVSSSRTKMEIYKIDVASPPLDVTDVKQLDPNPSKSKPGIADLAGNPAAVEDYLKPLLESAKKTVPAEKQATTHIFFLATAGMRLLSEAQSNAILDEVKKLFNDKNKCPFMFDSEDAKIISGAFEGIYGWISVNFLKGNFIPGSSDSTYGILDLGGASHQNAFESSGPEGSDKYPMVVGSKRYNLFARSYLGYGMDQARAKYLENLLKNPSINGVHESPCHHKGFQEDITINGEKITFVGTASVLTCRSIIQKTFFSKDRDCPFRDQPSLTGDFFGFSGIFYAARDTGMLCSDCTKPLSPVMFDEGSRNFCAKNYADVSSNPYAKNVCFESNYVYELLTKGYGISVDKTILVGKELNGFSLGWTLGAMLYNSELL